MPEIVEKDVERVQAKIMRQKFAGLDSGDEQSDSSEKPTSTDSGMCTAACEGLKACLVPPAGILGKDANQTVLCMIAGICHGSIVMLAFAGFASIIFPAESDSDERRNGVAVGLSQQLFSAGVVLMVFTWRGFFKFTIAGPTPPGTLLIAEVIDKQMDFLTDEETVMPTIMVTVAIVAVLFGLSLILISATGTAGYGQQLPFPVLCGFLGSVGVLLMRKSFALMTGLPLKWTYIPKCVLDDALQCPDIDVGSFAGQLLCGITYAAAMIFLPPRLKGKLKNPWLKALILPSIFLTPLILFYFIAPLTHPLDDLRSTSPSWLFKEITMKPFYEVWKNVYDFGKVDFAAINKVIPDMLICVILCNLGSLINISGIETAAQLNTPLDLNAEFGALGVANVFSGLLGGALGHPVAAFTLPSKADGGIARIAPFCAATIWLVCFVTGAPVMNYVPRFFVGGCFLQIGFGLARTFLWDTRKALDSFSLATAWCCVIFALFLGLNSAAYFGLGVVLVSSIRTSLRQPVIRDVQRLDEKRSSCCRSLEELQLLKTHGHKIMVVALQGYLFWGCISSLTTTLLELTDGTEDDPDTILIDVGSATGVDVSVVNAVKKMTRIAKSHDITIYVTGLPKLKPEHRSILQQLPNAKHIPLDDVLQEEENKLIALKKQAAIAEQDAVRQAAPAKDDAGDGLSREERIGAMLAQRGHAEIFQETFDAWLDVTIQERLGQSKICWKGFTAALVAKGMSETSIQALIAAGRVQRAAKGKHLVKPVHPSHRHIEASMFLVISGEFGTSYGTEDNVLLKATASSVCGEQDVFASQPPSVWITCLSDEGYVLKLSTSAFKLVREDPTMSLDFMPFLLKETALNAFTVRDCFR